MSLFPFHALGAPSVSLNGDLSSPQPVGTAVLFAATPDTPRLLSYQFSVSIDGGPFRVVRDYSLSPRFRWSSVDEASYVIKVKGRGFGSPTVEAENVFTLTSRVTGSSAVISPTAHPLVALYSAPPCTAVGFVYAEWRVPAATWQSTTAKPCVPDRSTNFYIAGMLANTTYHMRHVEVSGTNQYTVSSVKQHTSGVVTRSVPQSIPLMLPTAAASDTDQIFLHSMLDVYRPAINIPFATDWLGRLLWYYDGIAEIPGVFTYLTRPLTGGTMLILGSCCQGEIILLEIDLAGNTLRQTSKSAINTQLAALGEERLIAMHHDAIRLPDGSLAVLGIDETSRGQRLDGLSRCGAPTPES